MLLIIRTYISDPMNYRNDQNYVDVDFEPMADDNELYPDAVSSDLHKCSQEMSVSIVIILMIVPFHFPKNIPHQIELKDEVVYIL